MDVNKESTIANPQLAHHLETAAAKWRAAHKDKT
jgi:hypothetical protein